MKRASVSEAKNGLSAFLKDVRSGETVLITHRDRPVAQIKPFDAAELTAHEAAAELVSRGVADPPRAPLDIDRFLAVAVPRLPEGCSASRLIGAERAKGR